MKGVRRSGKRHSRMVIYGDHRWVCAMFMRGRGKVSTREWGEGNNPPVLYFNGEVRRESSHVDDGVLV